MIVFAMAVTANATPAALPCTAAPVATIETEGGPEDVVAVPLPNGAVRLFVRERSQIGAATLIGALVPARTTRAWRPSSGAFDPLGMSLVRGARDGDATLYVLDRAERPRIWRLAIENGAVNDAAAPWVDNLDESFEAANDIQAVGDAVYVTRFDASGMLSGWVPWRGVARVRRVADAPGWEASHFADGFRGANGIIHLGDRGLLVSDYWGRRLRFISKSPDGETGAPRFATAGLPIHPDNLTLDGDRVLIAGQYSVFRTFLNLALPSSSSPSGVLSIGVDQLGANAMPQLLWDGDRRYGRSVSVAVRVPGGLALGQIRSSGVLIVRCGAAAR
ncbi:MAG: hypothetical protein HYU41_19960 [Candidatus Rokubacteria bacterium]|nr:hypothetical protein [Candidatus Rokubacteria bacterium]